MKIEPISMHVEKITSKPLENADELASVVIDFALDLSNGADVPRELPGRDLIVAEREREARDSQVEHDPNSEQSGTIHASRQAYAALVHIENVNTELCNTTVEVVRYAIWSGPTVTFRVRFRVWSRSQLAEIGQLGGQSMAIVAIYPKDEQMTLDIDGGAAAKPSTDVSQLAKDMVNEFGSPEAALDVVRVVREAREKAYAARNKEVA